MTRERTGTPKKSLQEKWDEVLAKHKDKGLVAAIGLAVIYLGGMVFTSEAGSKDSAKAAELGLRGANVARHALFHTDGAVAGVAKKAAPHVATFEAQQRAGYRNDRMRRLRGSGWIARLLGAANPTPSWARRERRP